MEMVNPFAKGAVAEAGVIDESIVAEIESMSNRPWNVTVAPGVVEGWRSVTFATEPEPVKTQRPVFLFRQNLVTDSIISAPPGSSSTYGDIEDSLSRVIITGGLGLFLDPGGRPLGLLTTSIDAPSLLLGSFLLVVEGVVIWLGLRLSASSEV